MIDGFLGKTFLYENAGFFLFHYYDITLLGKDDDDVKK